VLHTLAVLLRHRHLILAAAILAVVALIGFSVWIDRDTSSDKEEQ
jgi:hypothetical protein